jgi:hypothetical protein
MDGHFMLHMMLQTSSGEEFPVFPEQLENRVVKGGVSKASGELIAI